MRIGTKSLLFGYHQFLIHPAFVFVAYVRLYGWTWDPRVALACLLHDVGYLHKPNMDGPEGKDHPFLGAKIMHVLFDHFLLVFCDQMRWHDFTIYHSRTMAKRYHDELSRLGYADKLAFELYPIWLIRLLGGLSGENLEYMGIDTQDSTTALPRALSFDEWVHQAKLANMRTLTEAGLTW